MAEELVLSAEQHFETLREAVWVRFCARHRGADRDRFDDLYAEGWAREVERAAKGRPSRAAAPAAFIAEAVHRVLIDDARSRARGLGRDAKGSLELVDLGDQQGTAAAGDTAQEATYEALVHRVLTLVRDRLTERETRVFVWSFLYLQTSEATAAALGLSLPRVRKDRKRIAGKVGEQVWAVLAGELDLCAAYDEKSLPAVFEILTIHVEDCPVCSAALGGVRRGALAVVGPELVVLEASTQAVSGLLDTLLGRVNGLLHRSAETLTALPPNGRTAAAVAVAATAVAGGAATVAPKIDRKPDRKARAERKDDRRRAAAARARATTAPPAAPATPTTAATAAPPEPQQRRPRRRERTRDPLTFERQSQPPAAPPSTSASTAQTTSPPPPSPASASAAQKEFSFEQP